MDQTGVGRPVVDMLRAKEMDVALMPITITAGHAATKQDDGWHVPKKDLVSALQVILQSRRLKVAKGMKLVDLLLKELANFRVKITAAANETFEAWREGDKDDLVLASALGAWIGETRFTGAWDASPAPGSQSIWESVPRDVFGGSRRNDEDEGDIPSPRQVYGCSDEDDDRIGRW